MSEMLSIIMRCCNVLPSELLFRDQEMNFSDWDGGPIYRSYVLELYAHNRLVRKFRLPSYLLDEYENK